MPGQCDTGSIYSRVNMDLSTIRHMVGFRWRIADFAGYIYIAGFVYMLGPILYAGICWVIYICQNMPGLTMPGRVYICRVCICRDCLYAFNYAGSMQGPNYAGSGRFGARPMQGLGYGSLELQREQISHLS
jgi:hypothetical protein